MAQDDRKQRNDDIARLKQRLGEEAMPYQDISREGELLAACRRWPLLAESEGWSGDGAPVRAQANHKAPQA
ncbi:cellulose biosynthesis protein BcsR [Pseudomonas sp. BJa5]|uniref:cellulose biosynthesis protein BcsR n=1 Tax=Pseudomonas sp. BJa5 TaxID=2936270 RepID=UPI002559B270|nr:cellulose biosynthesis protein BcsR [Pseudomonas sp. BGr12]MDL2420574.1 cellulose biosynthesis protein BcsR [Pseudomonas sp. BGr12]